MLFNPCSPCCSASCVCSNFTNPASGQLQITAGSGEYSWMNGVITSMSIAPSSEYSPTATRQQRYLGTFAAEYPWVNNDIQPAGTNDIFYVSGEAGANNTDPAQFDTSCYPFWLVELICSSGVETLSINNNTYRGVSQPKGHTYDYHYTFKTLENFGCGDDFHADFNQADLTGYSPPRTSISGDIDISVSNTVSPYYLAPSSLFSTIYYYDSNFQGKQALDYNASFSGYFRPTGVITRYTPGSNTPVSVSTMANTLVSFQSIPGKKLYPQLTSDLGPTYSNNYAEWRYTASGVGASPTNNLLFNNAAQILRSTMARPWPVGGRTHIYLPSFADERYGFYTSDNDIHSIPMRFMNDDEDCYFPVGSGIFCNVNGTSLDFVGNYFSNQYGLEYYFEKVTSGIFPSLNLRAYALVGFGPLCYRTFKVSHGSTLYMECGGSEVPVSTVNTTFLNISGYFNACDPFYFTATTDSSSFNDDMNPHIWAWGSTTPYTMVSGHWVCGTEYGCVGTIQTPPAGYFSDCLAIPDIPDIYTLQTDPPVTINGLTVYYDVISGGDTITIQL